MKRVLLWIAILYLGDILDCTWAVRISISSSLPYAVRYNRARRLSSRNAKAFSYSYQPPLPLIPATSAPVTQYYQQAAPLQQPVASVLPASYMPQPVTYHQPVTIYPATAPVQSYPYNYVQQQPSTYGVQQVEYSYNEPIAAAPVSGYRQPPSYGYQPSGNRYGGNRYGGNRYGGNRGGYQGRPRYDYQDDPYGGGYDRQDDGYRSGYDGRDDGYGGGYGGRDDGYGGGYGDRDAGYGDRDAGYGGGYGRDMGDYGDDYGGKQDGYGRRKYKKEKIVYVPVYRPRKKKKKMKIISIMPGFFVAGGTQLFGKYKSLKYCEKACAATPSCFAGDYNPWLKKCYLHTNFTACETLRAHKKLVHFSKVPCQVPEAPVGLVTLGAQLFRAIEQKGIKSLSDCLKRCATAGKGIPASVADIGNQLCFGIDYDFGSHKCYFHVDNTNNRICPADGSQPKTPRDLVANPAVVNIILCPGP